MKRFLGALLLICQLLTGCESVPAEPEMKQYNATFLTLFDTVTTVVGKAPSEEAFQKDAQAVHDRLKIYHELLDIYNEYEGITNLKVINDRAATAPVEVDPVLIEFLLDCKHYCAATGGRVNAAMGSVLRLWHDARTAGINDPQNAALPDEAALAEAAKHCSMEDLIIDEEKGTVFFADPALSLDVGAIAKGWATQRVAGEVSPGLLISVGGNVCATGPKDAAGTPWVVGVENPDGGNYLHTLDITGGCVVTSGDYQRAYTVDGKRYHHIIDPDTLYPAARWRAVTVLCPDSADGDALSTALFLLDREEGLALLEAFNAHALWVDSQGKLYYSPGFQEFIRT